MLPVLYSFRRCPYAMRARLAIRYSNIKLELREVDLKNKPPALLQISAKATVPVLVTTQNSVIDESLDIMQWALAQSDPRNWLQSSHKVEIDSLIKQNDSEFKTHLDHYKYADRFPGQSISFYRQQGEHFLQQLEQRLIRQPFLINNTASIADVALFPFIRQFAHVDIQWFESSPYPKLRQWLNNWLESELFLSIMQKHPYWSSDLAEQQTPVIL